MADLFILLYNDGSDEKTIWTMCRKEKGSMAREKFQEKELEVVKMHLPGAS